MFDLIPSTATLQNESISNDIDLPPEQPSSFILSGFELFKSALLPQASATFLVENRTVVGAGYDGRENSTGSTNSTMPGLSDLAISPATTTLMSTIFDHLLYNDTLNGTGSGDIDSDDILELSPCDPSNVAFNCTVEQFLEYARGPQTLPLITALLVTIFFVGIFVTGVVGNVIVCVVIVRNSSMHTATNYYLFSLAVSDLIFLMMGLPYEISLYWHQYPYNLGLAFCKIRALISEASTYVSVLTIVAFSMERFLAICHPLHLYTMSGFQRAWRIIAALWVISFLSAVPFAVFTKIDFLKYPMDNSTILDSAFCAMLENPPGFPLWELSSCLFFVIPMILIMILYGHMGRHIRTSTRDSEALGSMHKESRHLKSRRAIIRMLAAVVITFFVCWAPFHAQRLTYLYARDWAYFQDINTWLFSIAGWFYYVSCTINPILYNVMSHRYRVAFKETLCGKRKGFHSGNGFSREQSSFRETTFAASGNCDNAHLVRLRSISIRNSQYKDRDSLKSGNRIWRNKTVCSKASIPAAADGLFKFVIIGLYIACVKSGFVGFGSIQTYFMFMLNVIIGLCLEEKSTNATNVVVVMENNANGQSKVYKENNLQEALLKKNETFI